MKKFITILTVLLVACVAARGQTVNKKSDQTRDLIKNYLDSRPFTDPEVNAIELSNLMIRESRLLDNRKVALILSISGTALGATCYAIRNDKGGHSPAVKAFGYAGLATAAAGGVWLLVNEFQLIAIRKDINDRMQIRIDPTGFKINF